MLKYNTRFLNNSVFFIDCLSDGDFQTARRLFEDVIHFTDPKLGPRCEYFKISSKQDLVSLLGGIAEQCRQGLKPILHFEAHGSILAGLEIGNQKEKITWTELIPALRAINTATKNNSGVVMAACFGLHIIKPVSIHEPTPFFFLIGSESELYATELEAQLRKFYETIIRGNSLNNAMDCLSDKFKCYHSEKYFLIAMGRYFKQQCMGKGRKARVERLVTEINQQQARSRKELKKIRNQIKNGIKPSPEVYFKYAHNFLHGQITATFTEFMSFLRREQ